MRTIGKWTTVNADKQEPVLVLGTLIQDQRSVWTQTYGTEYRNARENKKIILSCRYRCDRTKYPSIIAGKRSYLLSTKTIVDNNIFTAVHTLTTLCQRKWLKSADTREPNLAQSLKIRNYFEQTLSRVHEATYTSCATTQHLHQCWYGEIFFYPFVYLNYEE